MKNRIAKDTETKRQRERYNFRWIRYDDQEH
jgi:hypothetical protein